VDRDARIRLPDVLCLVGILVLAIATRLPGLALRGQWDADQGNELLVMLHWVRDGSVPLLGPSTFAGTFHHGALYYYLLAPAAFLTDVDPHAIVVTIALLGLATVAAIWALGYAIGGRWTGHVAGILAAASPALVLGSTFIWNPNPVPLGASLAVLGATLAWTRYSARWWFLAAAGCTLAMQLHVSGGLLLPPLVLAWVLDLARRPTGERGPVLAAGLGGAAIVAAGYLPLLVHELETGFTDTQGLVGYLRGGAGVGANGDLLTRMFVVAFRSIAWPFTGVITEAPMAAAGVTVLVLVLLVAAFRGGGSRARPVLVLCTGILLWSLPALALTAPTLLSAVPGLPNDHYHTYLDPIVLVVAATGIAAIAGHVGRFVDPWASGGRRESRLVAQGLGLAALVALVAVSTWRWPPASAADGGWPLADEAAVRLIAGHDVPSLTLVSLPDAKSPDAIRFPLERRGAVPLAPIAGEDPPGGVIVVCDPLFEDLMDASCGGEAELAYATRAGTGRVPLDRFTAGARRVITIFAAQ
jgi:4-amino-4-deoxy-L-arabinose transferase-like glycosyltransferase